MHLRSFILTLAGFCLYLSFAYGQPNNYGVPLITNYPYYETHGSEQNWCLTQDHRGVVYVGNQDKGILEYDGVEWRDIPVPNEARVLSLATGDDGVVYAGLTGEFGRLEPDQTGKIQYRSLCDSTVYGKYSSSEFWRTWYYDGKVYFCSGPVIFIYHTGPDSLETLIMPEEGYFSFIVDGLLIHANFLSGLMYYDGDQFRLLPGGEYFSEMSVTGIVQYGQDRLLISTLFSGLFLFDTKTGTVDTEFIDQDLLEVLTTSVIPYLGENQGKLLVGTANDGLYILDWDFHVIEIISDTEGLIDETVASAYSDKRLKGTWPIWIAHWRGVSKVETNNPFRYFTERSGFQGLIHDIVEFNDKLFIATSQGLYFKSSTSSSTEFVLVPELQEQIWDLHVMEPSPGKELLLASKIYQTYVIDSRMNITTIDQSILNPPDNREDLEQYSGRHMIQDPGRRDVIYTGFHQLIGLQYTPRGWREILRVRDVVFEILHLGMDKYGYIWVSTTQNVLRIDVSVSQEPTMKTFTVADGLPEREFNTVFIDPDTREVLIGTKNNFYRYDYFFDTLVYDSLYNSILPEGRNYVMTMHRDHDEDYWLSFENEYSGWTETVARKSGNTMEIISEKPFQRLPNASVDVFYSDQKSGVWFSKSDELYHYDKTFTRNDTLPFHALIRKVAIDNGDSVIFYGTSFKPDPNGGFTVDLFQNADSQPYIPYRFNSIEFAWAAPFFEQEDQLEYSYKLEGYSDEWSEWSKLTSKEFTNLKYNRYNLMVRARNVYGDISEMASYYFVITRPWYATIPAIIAYILLSGFLVYLIIKLYTRRLKQENIRLEGIIEERTREIRKQKEELTDSIEYASRIQRALLPSDQLMNELNIDHFILFRPRDIVSGDFYWMGSKNGKVLIVAADCTGHGVPGAFMSMLGMTFLDEIVIKSDITRTDEIMEALREHVINSLEQSGKSVDEAVKDGMDLAMISVDIASGEIQYSGAYNPLYLVRKLKRSEKTRMNKGEDLDLPRGFIHDEEHLLIQLKADQMPIGVSEKHMRFSATTLKDEGFNIYMFSDGFLDQFGGPQGKKFMSKNFKKLLLELQSIPLKEQGAALEKVLLGWMGEISQIDDILVMGLRMNPA